MAAIGVGLVWLSYWWGLSGYSMIRGWNNSPLALANPVKLASFSTACYTGGSVFPSGDPGDSGPCHSSSGQAPVSSFVRPRKGKCPKGWVVNQATGECFPPIAAGGPRI